MREKGEIKEEEEEEAKMAEKVKTQSKGAENSSLERAGIRSGTCHLNPSNSAALRRKNWRLPACFCGGSQRCCPLSSPAISRLHKSRVGIFHIQSFIMRSDGDAETSYMFLLVSTSYQISSYQDIYQSLNCARFLQAFPPCFPSIGPISSAAVLWIGSVASPSLRGSKRKDHPAGSLDSKDGSCLCPLYFVLLLRTIPRTCQRQRKA
ncbi:hypothetical protein GGI35DRAFT_376201 [Trichoderma velutinum]